MNSDILHDTADSTSNAIVKRSVYINQPCAECMCLYTIDFESSGKNALVLYMTVYEKVVPCLDKYDDVIELNFMKIASPRNEELVAPLLPGEVGHNLCACISSAPHRCLRETKVEEVVCFSFSKVCVKTI